MANVKQAIDSCELIPDCIFEITKHTIQLSL